MTWFANERGRLRLIAESAVMSRHFPQFVLMKGRDGLLMWRGVLQPKGGAAFLVSAVIPARYPNQPPALHVLQPRLVHGCPHRFADGSLCVYPKSWLPATGTVVQAIANAADWLAHYEGWGRTGAWRS
jgi:ubiquitin-protein ligase